MNVDSDNFSEAYARIDELLQAGRCRFVAVDLEMTGITTAGETQQRDDLPFERYQSRTRAATRYNIIQIGLTFFAEEQASAFVAYPFNFYVFPRENPLFVPQLGLDASAMQFNTDHGMDWNRWIRKGITYVPRDKVERLREKIFYQPSNTDSNGQPITAASVLDSITNPNAAAQARTAAQAVQTWFDDDAQTAEFVTQQGNIVRRYLHTYIEEAMPSAIKFTDNEGRLHVRKGTPAEKAQFAAAEQQRKEGVFQQHLGFQRVVDLLQRARLPLVGHNCMMDILFFYAAFIGPLPESYDTFKKNIGAVFPQVLDTKVLFQELYVYDKRTAYDGIKTLKGTGVEDIRDFIVAKPQYFSDVPIALPNEFQTYDFQNPLVVQVFHEAGFDAYLTGWNFLRLTYHRTADPLYQQWAGKICLYQSIYAMDPVNEDVRIQSSEIVYVHVKAEGGDQQRGNNAALQQARQQVLAQVQALFTQEFYQDKESTEGQRVVMWRQHAQNYIAIELHEKYVKDRGQQFLEDVKQLATSENIVIVPYADYVQQKKQEEGGTHRTRTRGD